VECTDRPTGPLPTRPSLDVPREPAPPFAVTHSWFRYGNTGRLSQGGLPSTDDGGARANFEGASSRIAIRACAVY
jgi:hypothetical protein